MKKVFQVLIWLYQHTLSRLWNYWGFSCAFYPTCSVYARDAVNKYGILKGVFMAIRRFLRCHPWQKDHMDPVK